MRISTILSASTAILAAAAVPAAAQLKYENASGGSVLLYGQVTPTIQSVNDGESTTTSLVDNDHANTRVGAFVTQPYDAGQFKFNFETALGAPATSKVSQTFEPDWTWNRTNLRKIDFSFAADWGTVYAGQGSMATDGVAQNDLSGTTLTTYIASSNDGYGDFEFRNADGTLSGVRIDSLNSDFDGTRKGRVRYDSPSVNGFGIRFAAGKEILSKAPGASDDGFYDAALTYANDFDTVEVQGAVGYAQQQRKNASDVKDTFGSVSVLFQSGFNITLAAGSRQNGGQYTYGKLGYKANWFQVGSTAIGIDYYDGKDFNSTLVNDRYNAYGFGVTQTFTNVGMEGYFGYRRHNLKATGQDYQDIDGFLLGGRWKF